MNEQVQTAADAIRSEVTQKANSLMADPQMTELVQLIHGLNALEGILQKPKTTLASLFLVKGEAPASVTATNVTVARDEFVHIPALEAAKRYLRKVGKTTAKEARTLDEIVNAIKSGGGEVPNISVLRTQLIRSTADIKKVSEDVFGLLEWYPKKRGRPVGSGGASTDAVEQAIEQYEENAEATEGGDE
jgi:hypothetical protein